MRALPHEASAALMLIRNVSEPVQRFEGRDWRCAMYNFGSEGRRLGKRRVSVTRLTGLLHL